MWLSTLVKCVSSNTLIITSLELLMTNGSKASISIGIRTEENVVENFLTLTHVLNWEQYAILLSHECSIRESDREILYIATY